MLDMELNDNLLAVARAGAGTNNIPIDRCTKKGVIVFNTPGANANAVKELVIAGLLMSSRKIVEGIEWVKTLKGQENIEKTVESGKSSFVGPEIYGKKLGVIGLGAVGVLVANAARDLGMDVFGYDPFLSVDAAWHLKRSIKRAESIQEIASQCDYITIHIPLNDKTRNTFNKDVFAITKEGARLLNFSRDGIVNNNDLKEALNSGIVSKYVTDFASEDLIGVENIIVTPHLGASTPESEENCAVMAADQLREYILSGNITNSVNFPDCYVQDTGKARVAIIHNNVPNVVGTITTAFAKEGINIDNMINKSRGAVAYTLIDVDSLNGKTESILKELSNFEPVFKTRIIREL
ncbi:D-3-phosphoglycerate dehydrogenase [bioreactor metagenome]|uniref:phosphoglycerate dehydrogenase n=1 Tax=bioreactor metagenome TaxID=1076179 RepID=A0A645BXG0_9ZZZZ